MKGKKKGLKQKIVVGLLTLAMSVSSLGILSSCGQSNNPPSNDPPSIIEPLPNPVEEKVVVSNVVNEYFGNRDFRKEFDNSLAVVASKKVDVENIKSVELVSFEKGKSGNFVLNVKNKDELNLEDDELTFNGDTTAFGDFYNLSINQTAVVNAILADNEVVLTDEIVKDSAKHTAIKGDCADEIAKYDAQKTLFEGISADSITVKEDPAPIVEYVTVQSLVDQVFAGIDFDANLKDTAEKIIKTKAPINNVNKIFAIDFELATDGFFKVVAETQPTTSQSNSITSWSINADTTKFANYLYLSKELH